MAKPWRYLQYPSPVRVAVRPHDHRRVRRGPEIPSWRYPSRRLPPGEEMGGHAAVPRVELRRAAVNSDIGFWEFIAHPTFKGGSKM
ncbi:MAG TPA: hypothetical protein VKE74_33525 [Gemmataceae bacterium]|nr:hypothetical protein [Gemmataceae bacterium]